LILRRDGNIDEYQCQYTPAEKVLLRARDEAHRFANRYRTKQMSMEWRNTKKKKV
jgi:excinuclease UvrABC nuclease subunit